MVLLAGVQALFRSLGMSMWPADRAEHDRDVATTRARLGETGFERAWAEGTAMTFDEVIEYAMRRD